MNIVFHLLLSCEAYALKFDFYEHPIILYLPPVFYRLRISPDCVDGGWVSIVFIESFTRSFFHEEEIVCTLFSYDSDDRNGGTSVFNAKRNSIPPSNPFITLDGLHSQHLTQLAETHKGIRSTKGPTYNLLHGFELIDLDCIEWDWIYKQVGS